MRTVGTVKWLNMRIWYQSDTGEMKPSQRGMSLSLKEWSPAEAEPGAVESAARGWFDAVSEESEQWWSVPVRQTPDTPWHMDRYLPRE